MNPTPRTPVDLCAAASTSAIDRLYANQPIWFDLDLDLRHLATEDLDARHPGHTQKPQPDCPISERAQLHRGPTIRDHPQRKRQAGRRGELTHSGRLDAFRQLAGDLS